MTEIQIKRIKTRIEKYKKALADDKKRWGGEHHDGRGIRYEITSEYIKLKDYKGGLRYLNWFRKYFPDDAGYPLFLFESAFILFKNNKLKEAEKKAHRAFFSGALIFNIFSEGVISKRIHKDNFIWKSEFLIESFPYSGKEEEFTEFAAWLEIIFMKNDFIEKVEEYHELEQKLINEPDSAEIERLEKRRFQIKYE